MERMAERFLGFRGVGKPRWISTSDWDALHLSVDQVQYAALDAYLSFLLGVRLVASRALTARAECNTVSADHKLHWGSESDHGSGLEDFEEDKSYSYSDDSGSMEDAW